MCRLDGSDERRLTGLNRGWTDAVALSAPERFRFTRAGFELDVWVMRPAGFVAGRRYPTLLNIHGGPHAQYGHNFFDEFQVYAGAGYAVVYTNPRGSQGYGESFAQAVVGDWGGGDYADVMAALDEALARHPFIDPERLGVLGGSYGGFLTSWTVGHTKRFKAACSERAVNCQYTMFGTSDIGHSFNVVELGGPLPWEVMARYIERSPLTYAKDITTPLLILHSEDDLRCPIEQAEQLFVALKKLGREVRFVRFPRENHEMSRSGKPRHRLERLRRRRLHRDLDPRPAPEPPREAREEIGQRRLPAVLGAQGRMRPLDHLGLGDEVRRRPLPGPSHAAARIRGRDARPRGVTQALDLAGVARREHVELAARRREPHGRGHFGAAPAEGRETDVAVLVELAERAHDRPDSTLRWYHPFLDGPDAPVAFRDTTPHPEVGSWVSSKARWLW